MRGEIVPLSAAHIEYFSAIFQDGFDADRIAGLTAVDHRGLPLACGGVLFDIIEERAYATGFIYLGPEAIWWRRFPRLGVQAVKRLFSALRKIGCERFYCEADPNIPGADRFIEWLGGEKVKDGIYAVELSKSRF